MRTPPLIVLAAALALPATAAAEPTLQPLKPCYAFAGIDPATGEPQAEEADVAGSGFTPGAEVTVLVDGTTAARVAADPAGAIAARVKAPVQERGEREFTVTALEHGGAGATVTSRVTRLAVGVWPRTARWKRRVTFRGRGFTMLDRPVYAHYRRAGRVYRTVRIGLPKGPCGTFRVKRRQFPFKPRLGRWLVRFDQEPVFDLDVETPFRDLRFRVTSTFTSGRG